MPRASVPAALATLAALAGPAVGLCIDRASVAGEAAEEKPAEFIPNTNVPMPKDYEDYTRGRTPWQLFPIGRAPGKRFSKPSPGEGIPAFQANSSLDPERFEDASPRDKSGHRCAPGGDPAGHYFYNVWDPELVPFLVDERQPNRTDVAVVIAPGGGRMHIPWEAEGVGNAEWLNSLGINAFILKYRVPTNEPNPCSDFDIQRAMALVRSRAPGLKISPDRIGAMGLSAGVALTISLLRDKGYEPFDGADGVRHDADFYIHLYGSFGIPREQAQRMPRTFAAFTRDDPCIDPENYGAFQDVMEKFHTQPLKIVSYPSGGHGWGSCDYYPTVRGSPVCGWREEAAAFLEEHVLQRRVHTAFKKA